MQSIKGTINPLQKRIQAGEAIDKLTDPAARAEYRVVVREPLSLLNHRPRSSLHRIPTPDAT